MLLDGPARLVHFRKPSWRHPYSRLKRSCYVWQIWGTRLSVSMFRTEVVGANFIGYRSFFVAASALRGRSWNMPGSYETPEWRASSKPIGCPGWKAEPSLPKVAYAVPRGQHICETLQHRRLAKAYPFFEAIAQVLKRSLRRMPHT